MFEIASAIGRFLSRPKVAVGPISIIAGGGLTMIYGEDYALGIAFLFVAAVWIIVCWARSDELKKKAPKKLKAKPTDKQLKAFNQELKRYRVWKWLGIILPIVLLVGLSFYVEHRRRQRQLEDVFNKLVIEYSIPPRPRK